MSKVSEINYAICEIFGIDHTNVRSVVITVDAGQLPEVLVTKYIADLGPLRNPVTQRFTLEKFPNEH